jgi:hypothetical protein
MVSFSLMKVVGSSPSPGGGSKALRTAGSASADEAERTPAQMASRVRLSILTMPSRVSPQPSAATEDWFRMVTASMAEAGPRPQR